MKISSYGHVGVTYALCNEVAPSADTHTLF